MTSHPHDSANAHVRGRSEYVDDRPCLQNELHVGVVYSERAHAEIKRIHVKEALSFPGVVAVLTAEDFSHLHWGTIFQDQPLLAKEKVQYVGEVVALVVAEQRAALKKATKLVQVDYKDLPAVLSISRARELKSFIGSERKIERGRVEEAFAGQTQQLSGSIAIQGADHFYLESQAAVAYPTDSGGIEVHSSSQHPTETQHVVAHALGLSYKDVTCIVKRMGGAFGGKESQAAPFAAYAALAAHRFKRPARIAICKDDDMIITGKRNPFENYYRVAYDESGRILALDVQLFSDGGAYADLSTAIMERAMLHCDNSYFIPNVRIRGQVCKTHFHPHTAFRGFGGPKGVATIEKIIEEIAHRLGLDAIEIRKLNCYKVGQDVTPYGQKLENNLLPKLFDQLEAQSEYFERRREIQEWNKRALENPFDMPLRGLSLTSVKFGISFTTRFLNQGNALVIVHRDGTVQVSTGATEMGQGVNARIAQIVAEELSIPINQVVVMPTDTSKNANTAPTAASSGTDLNGSAALEATRLIKARLADVADHVLRLPRERWAVQTAGLGTEKEVQVNRSSGSIERIEFAGGFIFDRAQPSHKISFGELVNEAFLNRVSLSEYAHYKVADLSFNKLKGEGKAFLYFTQGAAATEVSIDQISGEVKVLRTDILMDLGRSINEGLDRGQVIGGFVQGLGWVLTENLFYSSKGKLLSHSPSTYKIPNIQDTPRVFNVHLLDNKDNQVNLRGTKAVGEPPLLLAISAWTAVMDALKVSREFSSLSLPATSEVVLRKLFPDQFESFEKRDSK